MTILVKSVMSESHSTQIKKNFAGFLFELIDLKKTHICTVDGDYINTILSISILICLQLLNNMDTHKHRSQEKLSIKKVSL